MWLRITTAVSLTLAIALVFAGVRAETPKRADAVLIYTSTPHYDALAWLQAGERFPSGTKVMLRSGSSSRELIPAFFATADANVSFDGTKVLFSGKKSSGDSWQIWEMPVAGGEPKQVTSCQGDCLRPFYLPEERIVYAHKVDGRFQLEAASIGGGEALRLTSIPGSALPTDVLRDGRILFEGSYPLGDGDSPEMYTVYPDGSGVESYRCDHGKARHSGKQMGSGDIVFVEDAGVARFTSALAHAVELKVPSGEFAGDMIEVADGNKVDSWRANKAAALELVEWNSAANTIKPLVAENGADLVEPQMVAPRAIPNRFPSALHNWNGANLLCLNAYTSKLKIAAGSVESVKLYTLAEGKPLLLGSAHVEADGSFFLHVPSDQPLQLELVDRAGRTVQREHGWFWMRRGEQRFCVGCHAGPERSPENAVPQVLVKSTDPVDMTVTVSAQRGGH
ncbi:MAG: HzsA-related protein [Terriglobales bacterium]